MRYFKRKLDDKNRLTIPTELREELSQGVVLTPGFGSYIHLYPTKVWDDELQTALEGDWLKDGSKPAILNEELADLADQLLDGMEEAQLDSKQGRIVIGQQLLDLAKIGQGTEVIGTKMPGGYWRLKASKK